MSEIKVKAKHEIESLIEKYRGYLESNDNIKEEGTKTDLILPMFRALGWNIEDSSEVSKEEKVISKSVDYGFKIDQGFCFLLEAKEIYESLDGTRMEYGERVSYVQKAINYSLIKAVLGLFLQISKKFVFSMPLLRIKRTNCLDYPTINICCLIDLNNYGCFQKKALYREQL